MNFDPITGQPINHKLATDNGQPQVNPQQMPNYDNQQKKKSNPIKIVLIVIGGFILFFVLLFCVIFFGISGLSDKMVCKSNKGDITIMYTKKQLTGYVVKNGMDYDYDGQKEYANTIGVEAYLDEFESWFETNTTGTCERK